MAPDNLTALRTFFACIETRLPEMVDVMYVRLFEGDPKLAPLFKGDLREQKARFTSMLMNLVILTRSRHLWPVAALTGRASIPIFDRLATFHVNIGVTPEHFMKMKAVLLEVCEERAAGDFTQKAAEALEFIFDVLARSLALAGPGETGLPTGEKRLQPPATQAEMQDPKQYFDENPAEKGTA